MMDELLSLIKENPRLTNAELAAALDRDEAQVAQQVRQYEADGVIKGYCAILDKEKAGDETVTALIEIKVQPKFGHGFDDFYTVTKDVDISSLKLQYEEVQQVKWADVDEIKSMIDKGIFIPYNKSFIDVLFHFKDHVGTITAADTTVPAAKPL